MRRRNNFNHLAAGLYPYFTRMSRGPALSGGGGGGGDSEVAAKQYATFVIAASDSTDDGKAAADYICDGTADNVEISAALAATTPSGYRSVMLLEGTYNIIAGLTLPDNAMVIGQGPGSVVKLAAGGPSTLVVFTLGDYSKLANLKIDGGGQTGTKTGVYASGKTDIEVAGCYFDDLDGFGVYLSGCTRARVTNNTILNITETGVHSSSGTRNVICDNAMHLCYNGVFANGEASSVIQGNTITRCNYGIFLDNSAYYNCIAGNTVSGVYGGSGDYGIFLEDAINNVVSNNSIVSNNAAGIFLSYSDQNSISHNTIIGNSWSTSTSTGINQSAGIRLDESDSNYIHGNTIRKSLVGESYIQQYSIWIDDSACSDNIVIDNDIRDGGNTGYTDAGTGTIYRDHDGSTVRKQLTVATGAVTVVSNGYYSLLPETGTTDDVDTISGGKDGMVIYLRNDNATNTVTLKNGTGNLDIGSDVALSAVTTVQPLIYDATLAKWLKA